MCVCVCGGGGGLICNGFTGYNGNVLGLIQTVMIPVGLFWELLACLGWLVKTTLILQDQTCRNK